MIPFIVLIGLRDKKSAYFTFLVNHPAIQWEELFQMVIYCRYCLTIKFSEGQKNHIKVAQMFTITDYFTSSIMNSHSVLFSEQILPVARGAILCLISTTTENFWQLFFLNCCFFSSVEVVSIKCNEGCNEGLPEWKRNGTDENCRKPLLKCDQKRGFLPLLLFNIPPVRTEGSREKAIGLQWNCKT